MVSTKKAKSATRRDRNTTAKRYKALTPVLLTDEEQDQVQAIRDEYREATN